MSTSMSSREFNQHTSEAKKAAETGPVFITGEHPTILDLLTPAEPDNIEFDPERLSKLTLRPADLD